MITDAQRESEWIEFREYWKSRLFHQLRYCDIGPPVLYDDEARVTLHRAVRNVWFGNVLEQSGAPEVECYDWPSWSRPIPVVSRLPRVDQFCRYWDCHCDTNGIVIGGRRCLGVGLDVGKTLRREWLAPVVAVMVIAVGKFPTRVALGRLRHWNEKHVRRG